MSHDFVQGADGLVMHEKDDVATVLRDMAAGELLRYRRGSQMESLELLQPIPFGHKAAINAVNAGADVYKYGDVIGRATTSIRPGEHVHVHNIEGVRGRGDLTSTEGGAAE